MQPVDKNNHDDGDSATFYQTQADQTQVVEEFLASDGPALFVVLRCIGSSERIDLLPKPLNDDNLLSCYTCGRKKTCDIKISNAHVSTLHCKIYGRPSTIDASILDVVVEDFSTNGTFINRDVVLRHRETRIVRSGDTISFLNPKSNKSTKEDVDNLTYSVFIPESQSSPTIDTRKSMLTNGSAASIDSISSILGKGRNIHHFFNLRQSLGRGACGEVFLAIDKASGETRAIKKVNLGRFLFSSSSSSINDILQEAELMRKISHEYIIKLYDIFCDDLSVYLVMEYVDGGDLFDRIVSMHKYPEANARSLVRRLMIAMIELHETYQIAHRDLKPENIMMKTRLNDIEIKITDFGLAKRFGSTSSKCLKTFCGTPQYFSPEVLVLSPPDDAGAGVGKVNPVPVSNYTEKADMWSIGVIIYILYVIDNNTQITDNNRLSGTFPFSDESSDMSRQICKAQFNFNGTRWADVSADAKSFISSLLIVDLVQRMSARVSLDHAWLRRRNADDDGEFFAKYPPIDTAMTIESSQGHETRGGDKKMVEVEENGDEKKKRKNEDDDESEASEGGTKRKTRRRRGGR